MVKLEPELKTRFKIAATREGSDMSKVTRRLVQEYLDKSEADTDDVANHPLIRRLSGTATSGMSTDEIMALTRGE